MGLLAAFLQDDTEQRRQQLGILLEEDPVLALWCVCRTARWTPRKPSGIPEIAAWLALHGPQLLADGWAEPRTSLAVAADSLACWADWTCEAVALAGSAARGAAESDREWVYLGALLGPSLDWLTACAVPPTATVATETPACLPPWLAEHLRDVQQPSSADGASSRIIAARGQLATAWKSPEPASELLTVVERARAVRERWLAVNERAAQLLPTVMPKLARLAVLENDFQRTLEIEKLEALKAWAYGASHEINNPLANISTRAQTLLQDESDPERRRKLAVIDSQAWRAHEMISDMMLFAHPPAMRREALDVVELVQQVLRELDAEAREQGTELLHVAPAAAVLAAVDREYLAVAVKSLGRNSLEALGSGGRVEFSVRETPPLPSDAAVGSWVEIQVRDTGPGISPAVRRHLFDPYFSGREAGRGLGLGLSKCWRIVTEHGGRIEVQSEPPGGATFVLRLPQQA